MFYVKGERHVRGRCNVDNPVESCEKRLVVEACERDVDRIASLIFTSNFLAIISAAFPLGARITGTCPAEFGIRKKKEVAVWKQTKCCNSAK